VKTGFPDYLGSTPRPLGLDALAGGQSVSDLLKATVPAGSLADLDVLKDHRRTLADIAAGKEARSLTESVGFAVRDDVARSVAGLGKVGGLGDTAISQALGDRVGSPRLAAEGALARSIDKLTKPIGTGIFESLAGPLHDYDRAIGALGDLRLHGAIMSPPDRDPFGARYDEPPVFYDPPPNPILTTNELLKDLTEGVGELRALTAAVAEAQTKQAELVGAILSEFVEGASAADKAGRLNLMVAILSLAVAILALAVPYLTTLL